MAEVLLVGFGSEILTDDGIGLYIVNDLKPFYDINLIHIQTYLGYSLDVVEQIKNYKHIIIVDGVKAGKSAVGNVYTWDCQAALPTIHLSSFHDIPLLDAIKLCKDIGWEMPESVHIIGIEITDNITFSNCLSEDITNQYDQILNIVKQQIEKILDKYNFYLTEEFNGRMRKKKLYYDQTPK